jgi:hypothetical protein
MILSGVPAVAQMELPNPLKFPVSGHIQFPDIMNNLWSI